MFANLKNKIKEETGSDLQKLASIPAQKITAAGIRGRHSRQGSGSSLGSMSLDGVREELMNSPTPLTRQDSLDIRLADGKILSQKEIKQLEKREDEWRRRLQKKEEELLKKLERKEEEWKKLMDEKQTEWRLSLELLEKEKVLLEEEKREIVKQKLSLEESVKVAEEYKKKVYQYQEDIDQLEGFQTQEMAKVKHLLLVKEQEVAEKVNALKDSSTHIETLRAEVNRLRRYEEELSNLQAVAREQEMKMRRDAEAAESRCVQLQAALEEEKSGGASLRQEVQQLRADLESERARVVELGTTLDRERGEKDVTLLRNAQVNQQMELARQELRAQVLETAELCSRIESLEHTLADKGKELERRDSEVEALKRRVNELESVEHDKNASSRMEQELRSNVTALEEQLAERNKAVRVLQQRLADMKKTLQRELRLDGAGEADGAAVLTPSSTRHVQQRQHPGGGTTHRSDDDDVNFKYLKHVLIKFLTSREYEAQHLTRAVATLLRFSPEEERLLRETLDWKMSWFGTRPRLGMGQTAKTIPPR